MYKVYFDGGSRGNPGPCGCGYVIYHNDNIIHEGFQYLQENTNNYAEYHGLYFALEYLKDKQIERLDIYGDSKLVICQIKDEWKIKSENLKKVNSQCKDLLKNIKFTATHIYREQNTHADSLANKAMDLK